MSTPLIPWKSEFETGLDEADQEHAHLLDRINALYQGLGKSPSETAVRDVLNAVYAEVAKHFAYEEKAMREHGYDQFAEHKADHDTLLGELRDIIAAVDTAVTYDFERVLMAHLVAWFSEHFRAKDIRLHQALDRPAKPSFH